MTFPPDGVDGFFISGFPFGQATTGFTYPKELENELGEYPLDLFGESLPPGQEQLLLDHFRHTFERHQTVAKRLVAEKDWDLFWVVFTGTDKMQHYFWKFGDPSHPEYDQALADEFGNAIRDFFVRVDEVVGELVAEVGPETNVLVLSDHGFGPIYEELRLFQWLQDERFFVADPNDPRHPATFEAYAPGAFGGLLRVAEKGRDYEGRVPPEEADAVRRRLKERLGELKDPKTGEPFAEKIFLREEIYSGPYVENAPDIVFLERPTRFVGRASPSGETFGNPSYTFSGFHRPDGILVAAGPSFPARAERQSFSILDVAPTIYWLFDVPLPHDLDGDVEEMLVSPDSVAARPIRTSSKSAVILPAEADSLSLEDREVLESLSYVK
jgi:predicted AlkP superfamily phosphohydrolase/phosphomutase